jgi:hypoxanthine phosphoribosyltransferase
VLARVRSAKVNLREAVRELQPILTEPEIQQRVRELAAELDARFGDSPDLVLVGVLKGAVYFLSDLSRAMATPHRIDFLEYASYAGADRREGRTLKGCAEPLESADVVLVDEICDTGETLQRLRDWLCEGNPRSVTVCVLLKKDGVPCELAPEIIGYHVGPAFLVGYGLDYNQRYRHLPYVAEM